MPASRRGLRMFRIAIVVATMLVPAGNALANGHESLGASAGQG